MSTVETLNNPETVKTNPEEAVAKKHTGPTCLPKTDIVETAGNVRFWFEMPGADNQSVSIVLEKNMLTIEGQVKTQETPAGYALRGREYIPGNYRRVFMLAGEFDRESIQASMKNGVLCVTLAKNKQLAPRKITVATE